MTNANRVRELLDPLDVCHVECDGFVRIAHYVLDREGIPHDVYVGSAEFGEMEVPLHFWIVLPSGEVVDYRLRMWTNPTAPHGVFLPSKVRYTGKRTQLPEHPAWLISFLSDGLVSS